MRGRIVCDLKFSPRVVQVFVPATGRIYNVRGVIRRKRRALIGQGSREDPPGPYKTLNNAALRPARGGQRPTCRNFFTVMHRRHYHATLCPHYAVLCYYLRYRDSLFICLASLSTFASFIFLQISLVVSAFSFSFYEHPLLLFSSVVRFARRCGFNGNRSAARCPLVTVSNLWNERDHRAGLPV